MARNEKDFCVPAGETFHPTLRYGSGVIASKPVSAITKAAPVLVTAVGHGLPNGWPCALVGVQGMTQINATRYPPQNDDWKFGTVISADTVQLNEVSSADFSAYLTGGFLVYDTPTPLAGLTFAFQVWAAPDFSGAPLVSLSGGAGITVDATLMTITPLLQTAGLAWVSGFYRLDATDGAGVVTELLRGVLNIA